MQWVSESMKLNSNLEAYRDTSILQFQAWKGLNLIGKCSWNVQQPIGNLRMARIDL